MKGSSAVNGKPSEGEVNETTGKWQLACRTSTADSSHYLSSYIGFFNLDCSDIVGSVNCNNITKAFVAGMVICQSYGLKQKSGRGAEGSVLLS